MIINKNSANVPIVQLRERTICVNQLKLCSVLLIFGNQRSTLLGFGAETTDSSRS